MSELRYVSVFSGIGGLEHPTVPPLLFCERDPSCQSVLRRRFEQVEICRDIVDLYDPPQADVVAGGWPCQDISSAGLLGGIKAKRSGLFFEMLRVAKATRAHTLVGENVPNLLTMNRGRDFATVLEALREEGFPFVAWRVLNARAFGLPQERRRLFIVASKERERAASLHAALPDLPRERSSGLVSGFYWTGGKRSICFSRGYVPALKIGATDDKGRAPVAILVGTQVRKLTAAEFLRLQGFEDLPATNLAPSIILRMAGNAVPAPMGRFVMAAICSAAPQAGTRTGFGIVASSGLLENGMSWEIDHGRPQLATNLIDFIDTSSQDSLSSQAAAGLIVRSARSGHPMPRELFEILAQLASSRTGRLRPSRGNSFEALVSMASAVVEYRNSLPSITDYRLTDQENEEPELDLGDDEDADE